MSGSNHFAETISITEIKRKFYLFIRKSQLLSNEEYMVVIYFFQFFFKISCNILIANYVYPETIAHEKIIHPLCFGGLIRDGFFRAKGDGDQIIPVKCSD